MKHIARIFTGVLLALSFSGVVCAAEKADRVLVEKSESRLYLIRNNEVIASFPVKFGASPKGHKQKLGDERTPEGNYTLGYKNAGSSFYKSIHISYPNAKDRETAKKLGVSPGGEIMIHGQPNGWESYAAITQLFNWTDGCIALTNSNMDIVWDAVEPGTPIEIRP